MIRKVLTASVLLASGFAFAQDAATPQLPLDHFIKHSQFLDVKISPTGEYLAATVMATEDTGALVVLGTADQKLLGTFKLAGKTFVSSFDWVNDERIVMGVAKKDGSLSNPRGTGELYAMDFNGKKQRRLLGPVEGQGRWQAGWLEDDLPGDDKFILISTRGVGNDEGDYTRLERMNVNTGDTSLVAKAPVLNAQLLADHQQRARFAWSDTEGNRQKVFYRGEGSDKWELLHHEDTTGAFTMTPLAFSKDDKTVYMEVSEGNGPNALHAFDVATKKRTEIVRDDNVDPFGLVFNHDRTQPYGVVFLDGHPRIHVFDKDAEEAKLRKMLSASFPGSWVSITSYTKDGRKLVFRTWSDRDPGSFYSFDTEAKKATFLLSAREWIDPEQMATVEPVKFTARDGTPLEAFLTRPNGSDGKKLPLILHPHGGPIGPFDSWGYDPIVQLLANRGYAVLQVNYRGSGNYGRAFMRRGHRQWGDGMIDDMTDAVKWAASKGYVDDGRVCIFGASYGGYAALQAPVREPELYQCAVGYVGVYDMPLMYTYGDIPDSDFGTGFLKETLGANSESLRKISPRHNADKIDIPVFLVWGEDDIRAHPKHSKLMLEALQKAGKDVQYLAKDYEGHGFFKEENNRELYTKLLAFFDQHIGAKAKPTAP